MITNRQNLPNPIVNAIEKWRAKYDRGESDITVTQLIAPPRKVVLETDNRDKIVEDAADLVYSTLGSAMHAILEESAEEGMKEERLYMKIGGWNVGGQIDILE